MAEAGRNHSDVNALVAAVLLRAAIHVDVGIDLVDPWPLMGPISAAIADVEIVGRPDVVHEVHWWRARITCMWRGDRSELAAHFRRAAKFVQLGVDPPPESKAG